MVRVGSRVRFPVPAPFASFLIPLLLLYNWRIIFPILAEIISDNKNAVALGFRDELSRQQYIGNLAATLDDFIRGMYEVNREQGDLKVVRIVNRLGQAAGFSETEIPARILSLGIKLDEESALYPDSALSSLFNRDTLEGYVFLWMNMQQSKLDQLELVSDVMTDGFQKW